MPYYSSMIMGTEKSYVAVNTVQPCGTFIKWEERASHMTKTIGSRLYEVLRKQIGKFVFVINYKNLCDSEG